MICSTGKFAASVKGNASRYDIAKLMQINDAANNEIACLKIELDDAEKRYRHAVSVVESCMRINKEWHATCFTLAGCLAVTFSALCLLLFLGK